MHSTGAWVTVADAALGESPKGEKTEGGRGGERDDAQRTLRNTNREKRENSSSRTVRKGDATKQL
eukprot:1050397-Heterocapsa_arctica.AAC.1